ncbi:MAG: PD40 domain-containing protein [Solirubrobacterales bacterium]|nr:PD40 domain-containing protein [Solirubrobacterales bacterium]
MRTGARHKLREFRAPDEVGAEGRAWTVVRTAYLDREPAPARRWRPRLAALTPALAVIAAVLVLSPAGARVGQIITHALGVRHAAPALSSLPSEGRVLVSGPGGTWMAAADGSTRRLGAWSQASWSPHGLYVAVAAGNRLAAVDPRGDIQWAITRPRVSDPRWYSPSGYRVAYLSGATLRVIAGDGTGDRLLATHVAYVAPAWRTGAALGPYELAYVTNRHQVVVRDADTARVLWTASLRTRPLQVMWSGDGRRLVVVTAHEVRTFAADGALVATLHVAASDAALSPDGRSLALVLNRDQVVVDGRRLFAGAGVRAVSWSPDGRWLLVDWPAADQWVFVRAAGAPRVAAVSRIAQQFSARGAFPQLEGWCCAARGPAG